MGYAKYVGRVGALAVALGIGTAVITTPGLALADETGASSNDGPSQNTSSTGSTGGGDASAPGVTTTGGDTTGSDPGEHPLTTTGAGSTTTTTTQGSTTTTVGGGSGPTVTVGSSTNTGSIGTTQEEVPSSAPPMPSPSVAAAPTIVETPSPATTPVIDFPPAAAPSVTATPTVQDILATVAATTPNGPGMPAAGATPSVGVAVPLATTLAGGQNTGQEPAGAVVARSFAAPLVDEPATTNVPEVTTFSALVAPTPPVRTVPPPSLVDTLLALPGAIISTAVNLLTQALAPLIGPGAPADNPVLWAVLAFVRRQFVNDTPTIAETVGSPDVNGNVKITLNATDSDGDTLVYTATGATKGSLTAGTDGHTFIYDPNTGATGTETITITASDATNGHVHGLAGLFAPDGGHTAAKQITLTISNPRTDQPPTLNLPSTSTLTPDVSGAVTFTVSGADSEGRPVAFSANTTQGSIGITTPGTFRYTPGEYAHALAADDYTGPLTATITVTATDSAGRMTTSTLTVPVTPTNAKPTLAATPTVGAPTANGAVPISFPVNDADHDPLTYTDDSAKGDITVVNGALVFVTTPAARHAAAADTATPDDKQATFTLTADDGHGGTTSTLVTVDIPSSGVVGTVEILGYAAGGPQYFANGTRALQTTSESTYADGVQTNTTRVVVIDTTTGEQVGTTTTMNGASTQDFRVYPAQLNAAGTRAVQTTLDRSYANGNYTYTTRVAVIDLTTGTQLGDTKEFAGYSSGSQFSADGTQFTQSTQDTRYDSTAGTYTTTTIQRVAVFDMATGAQVGATASTTTTSRSSSSNGTQFTLNGTRAVTTTQDQNYVDGVGYVYTTKVTVVDTATGAELGTTTLDGASLGTRFSTDGTRAIVATEEQDVVGGYATYTTRLAVIDTATGAQLGTTATLAGRDGATYFSANHDKVLVTVDEDTVNPSTGTTTQTMHATVIDTATGDRLGTTNLTGDSRQAVLNADGTRAVVAAQLQRYDQSAGVYTYTTQTAVIDLTTGAQVGATLTGAGYSYDTNFTSDGTRAILSAAPYDDATGTYSTRLVVINTTTGAQIGSAVTISGTPRFESTKFYANDTRVIVTTQAQQKDANDVTSYTTRVAVINMGTGAQLGTTTTLGGSAGAPLVTANETRAIVFGADPDPITYAYVTHIAVIDLTTGTQVGATTTVLGQPSYGGHPPGGGGGEPVKSTQFTPDGTRLVQTTSGYDSTSGGSTTHVVVIDIATGNQVGTATTLAGGPSGNIQFSPNATRVIQTTSAGSGDAGSTRLAVIDLATGTQVGTAINLTGNPQGGAQFSADGTRAAQTTYAYDANYAYTSRVAIIDATTGTQIGVSPPLGGSPTGPARFSADGKQVTQTTTVYDQSTDTQTTVVTVINVDQTGSNLRPTIGAAPTVSNPDPDGVVTGSVQLTDPDDDALSYVGTGSTPKGNVTVNADGTFTYTANTEARLAAAKVAATDADKQDTFTITAYDGHGGATSTAVTVSILPKNTPPVATPTQLVFANGILTGKTVATDVDGDPLTYTVTAQGAKGIAHVDPTTGAFTYTPTPESRDAAAATDGVDTDTFTITVDDGHAGRATSSITVEVLQTGVIGDGSVGQPALAGLQYRPDGTRAIRVATAGVYDSSGTKYTTSIAVIDTTTGAQVGDTVTIAGNVDRFYDTSYGNLQYSADGRYASQTTVATTQVGNVFTTTTRVAIIDTATGAVTVATLSGYAGYPATFTADGAHVVQTATSSAYDYSAGIYTYDSEIAVIDTATGAVKRLQDIPYSLSGLDYRRGVTLDAAGSRAIVRAQGSDQVARVEFVDIATGQLTEFSVPANGYDFQLSADGTRVIVSAFDYQPGGGAYTGSRIAIVDVASGLQVGSTIERPGPYYYGYTVSGDGKKVVIQGQTYDPAIGVITSLTAIDLATGNQLGTVAVVGQLNQVAYSADGKRAIITSTWNGVNITVVDTATFAQLGTTIDIEGGSGAGVTYNADGSRAVVLGRTGGDYDGGSTTAVVVDTLTGAQVGDAVTVAGIGNAQYAANGSRIVLTTTSRTNNDSGTARVIVLDAATGARLGSTVVVLGSGSTQLTPDGTRAMIFTDTYDYVAQKQLATRFAVVDLTTGTQLGTTLELPGYASPAYGADGRRAVLTAVGNDPSTGYTATVTVIDTVTGAQIGSSLTLPGYGQAGFNADASRIILSTNDYFQDSSVPRFSRFLVLDANTGAQLGSTITVPSSGGGALSFTPDGSRAVLLSYNGNPTTSLTLIDVATGTQIGNTVTVAAGSGYVSSKSFNADGTRMVVDVYDNTTDHKTHRVVIINTVTGSTQFFAVGGQTFGDPQFTPDGTKVILDGYDDSTPGVYLNRTTILAVT